MDNAHRALQRCLLGLAAVTVAVAIALALKLPPRQVDFQTVRCGIKGPCEVADDGMDHRTGTRLLILLSGLLVAGPVAVVSVRLRPPTQQRTVPR
jgi:hypothetical protein